MDFICRNFKINVKSANEQTNVRFPKIVIQPTAIILKCHKKL